MEANNSQRRASLERLDLSVGLNMKDGSVYDITPDRSLDIPHSGLQDVFERVASASTTLQQTFDAMDVEHDSREYADQDTPSISVQRTTPHASRAYPCLVSPVAGRPTINGTFLTPPTPVRAFLPPPDPSLLNRMVLPYPFRTREPTSKRLERIHEEKNETPRFRRTKRNSLGSGQIDRLVQANRKTPLLLADHTPLLWDARPYPVLTTHAKGKNR